jgi:dihydrofolate reductase/thymidylate synthase
MPINLVACVCIYKNKLAIGSNGDLLFKINGDHQFFKNLTTNSLGPLGSKGAKNIVLMGLTTQRSLPNRILPGRINFVLTNNELLWTKLPKKPKNLKINKLYYMNMETFNNLYYKNTDLNVFVIGGSRVYNHFLEYKMVDKLYITHVERADGKSISFDNDRTPDTYMNYFSHEYKFISYSEKYTKVIDDIEYKARILYYIKDKDFPKSHNSHNDGEFQYLNLMKKIFRDGNDRPDRTNTGTVSLFGTSMRFDISNSIPILTTKRVPFKTILYELLWMLQGNTDAKILQRQGVHIWDGNTSREFLDKAGLYSYPEGVLGAGYGWQLRNQGAEYSPACADMSKVPTLNIGGFDQLAYVEHLLKHDPFSRRIMFSYWNPSDFDKTALIPCHTHCQFYVTYGENGGNDGVKYLSCQFYMRSNDIFLGNSFNLGFYSILTYILAKRCGMQPKELIYTCGDTHIYKNHLEQSKLQLTRTPRPFPMVKLDDSLIHKEWQRMTVDDFELIGYFYHPMIKAPMAI